ncbi:MAG: hypothetical protein ABS28_09355 [Cryomorphaceae bacterium BACL22 MAG-120619-bin32]|jgi:hypothetical protein|nr:MAG: hypothetical protein ABS28_09355 [Cryomorphaceae bacterium BACL22 MAG-120619-bin32]
MSRCKFAKSAAKIEGAIKEVFIVNDLIVTKIKHHKKAAKKKCDIKKLQFLVEVLKEFVFLKFIFVEYQFDFE